MRTDAMRMFVSSVSENHFGIEGAKHFADMLKVNKTLQSIKCAALALPPLCGNFPHRLRMVCTVSCSR